MSFHAGANLMPEEMNFLELNELWESEKTDTHKAEEFVSRKSFSRNYRETPKVFRLTELFNYAESKSFFPLLGKTNSTSTSLHKESELYLM